MILASVKKIFYGRRPRRGEFPDSVHFIGLAKVTTTVWVKYLTMLHGSCRGDLFKRGPQSMGA